MKINKYLTPGCFKVLKEMRDTEEELVFEKGAGWWIGERQTNGKVAKKLLQLCLVKEDSCSDLVFRLCINESGRVILNDVDFVPPIIKAIKNEW